CAQCHNHPFDEWTQMDYFKMAAFSYGMTAGRYGTPNRDGLNQWARDNRIALYQESVGIDGFPVITNEAGLNRFKKSRNYERTLEKLGISKKQFDRLVKKGIAAYGSAEQQYREMRSAVSELYNPIQYINVAEQDRTLKLPHDYQYSDAEPESKVLPAVMMGDLSETDSGSLIDGYAAWMTDPENERFTTVIANRMWKRVFGFGLIEPLDEITKYSKPSHPELMIYLEGLMRDLDYDLLAYQEILYRTDAFQRMAYRGEIPPGSLYHFAGPALQRMSAEQIWDSVVGLLIEDPDHFKPRLEGDIDRLESQKQIYESLEGRELDDFIAMVQESTSITQGALEKQTKLRDQIAKARTKEDTETARELQQQLNRIRGQSRKELADLAYDRVNEGAEREIVLASFGMSEEFVGEMTTKLKIDYETSYPEGMDRNERKALERQLRADRSNFQRRASEMARASELQSPARRGHFLREFGQSDREVIENASQEASVPQALALLNGPIPVTVQNQFALLGRRLDQAITPEEKVEVTYLAILSRLPSDREIAIGLREMETYGPDQGVENLIWALLNTSQFLFIR
ncbi:MAG: DUF1553 domain-containing protein, partial [Verrucomicrobiota bacterium]